MNVFGSVISRPRPAIFSALLFMDRQVSCYDMDIKCEAM